ncbi:MAG: hypothetical protein ABIF77_15515 [bacterium]
MITKLADSRQSGSLRRRWVVRGGSITLLAIAVLCAGCNKEEGPEAYWGVMNGAIADTTGYVPVPHGFGEIEVIPPPEEPDIFQLDYDRTGPDAQINLAQLEQLWKKDSQTTSGIPTDPYEAEAFVNQFGNLVSYQMKQESGSDVVDKYLEDKITQWVYTPRGTGRIYYRISIRAKEADITLLPGFQVTAKRIAKGRHLGFFRSSDFRKGGESIRRIPAARH